MRKILIPTDFSDNAMNAIKYALEFFKYERCEFFFLHTYQDEIYADKVLLNQETLEEVIRIIRKRSQKQLNETLKKVKEISPNPKFHYKSISANSLLIDEADKIVEDENIDIIVMGTRGKTNHRKLTFGSHTLQVLKYVQCPVLAIPENYKYKQPKHILFPTNYMIPYKRRELKLLSEIAVPYRSVIDLLYISNSDKLSIRQKDNRDYIKYELGENRINFKVIDNKNITNAIYIYIREHKIDMLVMVNTRHSFLESILFQSAIDKISLHLDIPFLTMQNMRRYLKA